MGAGQKQVCEAAVLSEKTAVIMAASQVQEKDQGQDTAEELQTGAEVSFTGSRREPCRSGEREQFSFCGCTEKPDQGRNPAESFNFENAGF